MTDRHRTALPRRCAALMLCAALGFAEAPSADARTLRWAGRGDLQTTDPHAQNENLTNNINTLIYEPLINRDKKLGLVAALAASWTELDPTTWRFKLRPGVRFHDGTPFTADDVVFSFERARADTSQLRVYANASGMPKRIDDLTVDFTTSGPNPVELEHVVTINIMSRAWCEKNKALRPQNYTQKEDLVTAHAANGTGPYRLKSREPDIRTVLLKNPDWWGIKEGRFEGNVDELVYLPIVSDATRLAALMSGEVDIVNDPPPQEVPRLKQTPNIKALEGTENRIVFIGMDQQRDELLYSNAKGKNPFRDRRVRQALYQAIDTDAIFILQPVLATWTGKGDGDYNCGRYSNPKQDEWTAKAKVNMHPEQRLAEIRQALAAQAEAINHLPLHRQVIPWAMRGSVTAVHRADNQVIPYWVTVQ